MVTNKLPLSQLSNQAQLTKEITAQVKLLSDNEDEEAVTDSDSPSHPYDQAKALGKTAIDMDRIASGLPCGSESFLLMFARWKKLERDLYNERKKYVSKLLIFLLIKFSEGVAACVTIAKTLIMMQTFWHYANTWYIWLLQVGNHVTISRCFYFSSQNSWALDAYYMIVSCSSIRSLSIVNFIRICFSEWTCKLAYQIVPRNLAMRGPDLDLPSCFPCCLGLRGCDLGNQQECSAKQPSRRKINFLFS